MAELAGYVALLVVAALLIAGVWRQCVPLSPRAQLFDALGLLPQWKFFAQSAVATRDDPFDDLHLLARMASNDGTIGPWQSVFAAEERRWAEAIWNPQMRSLGTIGASMALIVDAGESAASERFHSSLHYLTLLRHCVDQMRPNTSDTIQFAIVATRGRGERPLFIRYLSAWHRP